MKITVPPFLIAPLIVCLGLLPNAQALNPPPDGGYPGGNTAEGQNALLSLTSGIYNTAVGLFSLTSNMEGKLNTAIGAGALLANTADENTAVGAGALLSDMTGGFNTANGAFALLSNTEGTANTAFGDRTLSENTTGTDNTANGFEALPRNDTGSSNTANGEFALLNNTSGSNNIALGFAAGQNVTTANNVICIGADGNNVDNACYIGQVFGATSSGGTAVFINSNGRLGTMTSSRRFKDEIKPMERSSEALFALKPVTFHYKKEIDRACTAQFGLVAEEVENVNPDLVVRDKEGKPYSVRYDQVNAMLLNEFLKEHKKVEELESTVAKQGAVIAQQQKEFQATTTRHETEIGELTARLKEQAAQIQKVNAQIELSKRTPQIVNNQ
jgi:hypothetical protein